MIDAQKAFFKCKIRKLKYDTFISYVEYALIIIRVEWNPQLSNLF